MGKKMYLMKQGKSGFRFRSFTFVNFHTRSVTNTFCEVGNHTAFYKQQANHTYDSVICCFVYFVLLQVFISIYFFKDILKNQLLCILPHLCLLPIITISLRFNA